MNYEYRVLITAPPILPKIYNYKNLFDKKSVEIVVPPYEVVECLYENELKELVVSSMTQKDYENLLDTAFISITPYFLGEQDSFSIKIQMKDRWKQSLNNLALLADRKLTNIFYETPKCCCEELALEQLKDVDTSNAKFLFDGSIFCFPPDLEYEDAKSLMSIKV